MPTGSRCEPDETFVFREYCVVSPYLHRARNIWRFPVGHALNRPGVLMRRVHEHHARHVAGIGVVIQPDDVPTE